MRLRRLYRRLSLTAAVGTLLICVLGATAWLVIKDTLAIAIAIATELGRLPSDAWAEMRAQMDGIVTLIASANAAQTRARVDDDPGIRFLQKPWTRAPLARGVREAIDSIPKQGEHFEQDSSLFHRAQRRAGRRAFDSGGKVEPTNRSSRQRMCLGKSLGSVPNRLRTTLVIGAQVQSPTDQGAVSCSSGAAEMRLTIEFIDAGRGVRLRTDGDVPGRLMVRAHQFFAHDHLDRFASCSDWYSDDSRVSGLHWTAADASDIAYISETVARVNTGLVIANWIPGDLAFGMARMWEALAGEPGWRVLTARSAAPLDLWLEQRLGTPVDPLGEATLVAFDSDCV